MLSGRMLTSRPARAIGPATLALALVLASTTIAVAQDQPPTTNDGPRFGAWGPGQAPPAAESAPPPATAAPESPGLRMAPPGQPAQPQLPPPPNPNNWGGCNYYIGGNWQIAGTQQSPYYRAYTSSVNISQYGSWLRVDQPDAGYTYYGQCNGGNLQLDVYQGSQFIGYENGTIGWGGGSWERWRAPRIRAWWQSFVPTPASGQESWTRGYLAQ